MISRQLSNQLKAMLANKKSDSSILRCLAKGIIQDQKILAESNARILFQKFPIIDTACRGNLILL
jgi:hypothetical protein